MASTSKPDLGLASSWRQFESLLLKQLPPQLPAPSPISPGPFSFLTPLRVDDTLSHLPAGDFHMYSAHPLCRSSDLVLCSECGQPVPPYSLSRHFDYSHSSPPPSPHADSALSLIKPALPLQPSYKLNSNPPDRHKIKKKKSSRPKESAPLSPPLPLSALKQEGGLRPSKRFPSFLADCSQPHKSAKSDLQSKNSSFSFYTPSLPPALSFRHLPPLPEPLVFSPAPSAPRLTPSGYLLTNRSGDRMHFALSQGTRVWIPCASEVWREAEVTQQLVDKRILKIRPLEAGEEYSLCVSDTSHLPHLKNPAVLLGDSDLTSLSYLHEPAVLASLELRYGAYNQIYTWCGIVLIAINPYQDVPLYAPEIARAYAQLDSGDRMDPHIYAVAEEARRKMTQEGQNQSIIVTGESGAGKTMSACFVMRYFADVTGLSDSGEHALERRVLACNPLLEAFGNAKTIRNDNSSRFGKFTELCFDSRARLIGANLRTYLLEKVRVVHQSSCERNFHIFYQLCAARATCHLLKPLQLSHSSSYAYLAGGGSMAHSISRDDCSDFSHTLEAMQLMGLPSNQITEVFSLLAGILHLGNIEISSSDGEEALLHLTSRPLISCASMWGVPPAGLSKGMLQRQISTSRDHVTKCLTQREAIRCRDGFAKFLYAQLFRWLVSVLNTSLCPPDSVRHFIGVLDIYGFESLEINSFEQLLINYANEKLQLLFTEHVFRLEQEEYLREAIPWSYIPFSDNVATIQLIESHLGILDLLDETCQMPRATDKCWTQKLSSQHAKHGKFQRTRTSSQAFRVQHYAGWAEYQSAGFVEKNTDPVAVDLVNLLRNSTNSLVCELGDCPALLGSSGSRGGPRRSSFRSLTVANQFRRSLTDLVDKLRHTTSHYIRCIKPNDSKDPFRFSSRRVVGQLRACGVLETVRISADGYPSRLSYADFFTRYSILVPNGTKDGADSKQNSCLLLASVFKDRENYQLGRTKAFLRSGAVAMLERERTRRLETAVVRIQALARGASVRSSFRRARFSALRAQSHARGILFRRELTQRTDTIGTQYRLLFAYRGRETQRQIFLHSLVRFQATVRRVLLQRELHRRKVLESVVIIQKHLRGYLARDQFARVKRGVTLLQACVRRRAAEKRFREMKANRRVKRERESVDKNWGLEKKIFQLQRRLSAKEFEINSYNKHTEKRRNGLERSFSVRYTRPCVPSNEDCASLKRELDLERKQRALDYTLHRQQVEQLRLTHRREVEELMRELGELKSARRKLSGSSMEFEIVHKEYLGHNTEKREAIESVLRESSPSGRSSGGIESGIDVSSVCLDPWGRTRSDSDWLRFNELEIERVWICNLLEKFSPSKQTRPLSDLLGLLSPDLGPPPVTLTGTKHFPSLLQLLSDLTELRHELSLAGPQNGRRDSLPSRSQSSLSFPAIPEGCSVGHRRKSSVDSVSPRSRTTSLLTSSLTSSLLSGAPQEPETDCLLQQIQSLKQANLLLHTELEEEQKRTDGILREKDSCIHKLQQKIAAIKSMSYGARSPMEAKLQQEVSRLTQENMDVTSELETVQDNLKTLKLSPAVSLASINSDSVASVSKLAAAPLKRGLLQCPRGQEDVLIRTLVLEMRPNRTTGLPPGLPAHLLFLAIRSADERQDERQVETILSGCVRAVRQLIRQSRQDLHLLSFWLCNVSVLIGDLKQFSGEEAYQVTNNDSQRKECLQNFDLTDFRYLFNDLCVGIYHDVITAIQERIQHLVVPALLEHQGIPTVTVSRPIGWNADGRRARGLGKRGSSILREEVSIRDLVRELSLILEVLRDMGVSSCAIKQLMRQTFYFMDSVALNNILLRKDLCHWSRGLNIRHNLSQLEDWGRTHSHLIDTRALDALLPLVQAAQLLQINKKERDAAEKICGVCSDLSPLQIQKLLTMYTPANEFEERVPPNLIRAISQHFNLSVSNRSGQDAASRSKHSQPKLMQDVSLVYPPTFPYAPSPLLLSEIDLPPGWDLSFLKHI